MANESISDDKVLALLLALKKALGSTKQLGVAIVDEVNEDETIDCSPIGGGAKFFNVQTKLDDSQFGYSVIPQQGSLVLLACSLTGEHQNFMLYCACPAIIRWRNSNLSIEASAAGVVKIDASSIELNGGKNGGLVLAPVLKGVLDDIVEQFNAHTHPSNGAIPAKPIAALGLAKIENPLIKQ